MYGIADIDLASYLPLLKAQHSPPDAPISIKLPWSASDAFANQDHIEQNLS
jgi:hypothetical protein